MLCVPTAIAFTVKDAEPSPATGLVPNAVAPSAKLTVPVGPVGRPAVLVTRVVNVSGTPNCWTPATPAVITGVGLLAFSVRVLVLAAVLASPLYEAVTLYVPDA